MKSGKLLFVQHASRKFNDSILTLSKVKASVIVPKILTFSYLQTGATPTVIIIELNITKNSSSNITQHTAAFVAQQ